MVFVTAGATAISLLVLLTMKKSRIGEFKGKMCVNICILEKLVGFFKDFLRTRSSIPV